MPTSFQQFIGGAGDVLYPGIDLEPLSTAFDLYSSNPDPNLYSVIQQGLGLAQQLVSARRAQDLPGLGTNPGFGAAPQIESGVSARFPGGCWVPATGLVSTRKLARRRVKMQRMPDGSIQVVQYCQKPRMNPLNAKALGRAARRLGSFQRIAAHVEKVITKACKPKRRSSRAPRMGYSCGPKRGC